MAAIAVGETENGGALIVVRIVLSGGFDPADYSEFQALFGMIFTICAATRLRFERRLSVCLRVRRRV